MKLFFILFVLLPCTFSSRRYFPEENEKLQSRFIIYEEDDGSKYHIDLEQPVGDVKVNASDIKFYLFTQNNKDNGVEIELGSFNGNIGSDLFDATRVNFFCAHGYNAQYNSDSNVYIKNAILSKYDANVFLVDYSKDAGEFYTYAVLAVPQVGIVVGEAIEKMMVAHEIAFDNINLYGHSLGAHVAGATGARLNGNVNFIVGTDPAGPLFYLNETETRLDESDGKFVHVIHTNGGLQGFRSSMGHADYFPNGGGMDQPGCGTDLLGGCAHSRGYKYFSESIESSGFLATSCSSYEDYKLGFCKDNPVSYMGEYSVDKEAFGDYYLDTAEASPFALNGTLTLI